MTTQTSRQKRHLKAAALSFVRSGDLEGAIDNYKQYLVLNPDDDDAWAGLGGAYRRKGNLKQAIDSYEKSYKINAKSTYAIINIVTLLAARNSKEDKKKLEKYLPAAKQLTQVTIDSGEADYWAWYDLATLQLIEGHTDAISTFNYAADLTPKTAKENFRSVLNNLNFLKLNNPTIQGIDKIIETIESKIADSSTE